MGLFTSRKRIPFLVMAGLFLWVHASRPEPKFQGQSASSIRVLVVTGGHAFEQKPFFEMFGSFDGMEIREAVQPKADSLLVPELKTSCDVVVFYDYVQKITLEQKNAFVNLLQKGIGVLFLHHSICSYQDWDEYETIVGGRYHLKAGTKDGRAFEASTYKHDVEVPVHVVDPGHPVVQGIQDFILHDEAYGKYEVLPDMHPLLETDHPESAKTIGWWHVYGKSPIVFIQLGHDHWAYEHPMFRKLVRQAIVWVSRIKQ